MDNLFGSSINIEKIAAFLDGNLSDNEISAISSLVDNDASLKHLITASALIDNTISNYSDSDLQVLLDFSNEDITIPNINTMTKPSRIYGILNEGVYDPIYIEQPDDHSCALKCQQIIMRDYGIDIPFEDLEKIALENHIYSSNGTLMCDMGKAMELAGISYHVTEGNTVNDLMRELAQGHRVMVAVDSNELWYNSTESELLKNKASDALTEFFKKVFHVNGGNHALIVAGIEVNPDNPNDLKVILTDPGDGHFRITYPAYQFADAWHDSNCFMVATDKPAPYQYDIVHHQMVPSQFAIQDHLNEWVTEHSYQLSPDIINVPEEHIPYYSLNSHCSAMLNNLGLTDIPYMERDVITITDQSPSCILSSIDINQIPKATLSQIISGGSSTIDYGDEDVETGGVETDDINID